MEQAIVSVQGCTSSSYRKQGQSLLPHCSQLSSGWAASRQDYCHDSPPLTSWGLQVLCLFPSPRPASITPAFQPPSSFFLSNANNVIMITSHLLCPEQQGLTCVHSSLSVVSFLPTLPEYPAFLSTSRFQASLFSLSSSPTCNFGLYFWSGNMDEMSQFSKARILHLLISLLFSKLLNTATQPAKSLVYILSICQPK